MSSERWHLIDTILAAALERPPAERSEFVQDETSGDSELLDDLEALLNIHAEADRLLGESVASYAAPLISDLVDHLEVEQDESVAPGARIGPYEILYEIGRGGMGSVYLAKRADASYEKLVALKLVRRGLDTYDVLQRFRNERQILASLEHPNVARLHDGGVSADGRPYFIMEYVEGEPIDAYCNRNKLAVPDRLKLFVTVCKVVSYAHQNLVVHRDLKPSNILVTPDGTVKLLDFGIARLLDPASETLTADDTRTGMRLLSLRYAAPEQLLGTGLTTASDVYALGVILYEILSGQSPFDRRRSLSADTMESEEPPLPSRSFLRKQIATDARDPSQMSSVEQVCRERSTTVERLQKALKGDLDTILLMALRNEPDRRYRSTDQLTDDIMRHLTGLPVSARADTLRYRLLKFAGRHRGAVAASLGAVLMLTIFVGALVMQHAQTLKERNHAMLERDKAQELAIFLEGLFEASSPFQASAERLDTLRAVDLLERGARKANIELNSQPPVQAQMFHAIGKAFQGLGRYSEAHEYLEAALEIRRSLSGPARGEIAGSLADLGYLLYLRGAYSESETRLREALAYYNSRLHPPDEAMADAIFSLAVTLEANGSYAESEQLHREALEIRQALHGAYHPDIAASLSMQASLLATLQKYEEAITLFRESLAVRRQVYGTDHPGLAIGLNNLAVALRDAGDYDEAEVLIREALRINRQALGTRHPNVADNMTLLASVLRNKGAYGEAEPIFRESVALTRDLYGDEHPTLSVTLSTYAALLDVLGRDGEAEAAHRESLSIARNAYGNRHYAVGITTARLAGILHKQGQYSEALSLYHEAESVMQEINPGPDSMVLTIRQHRGNVLIDTGAYDEAERILLDTYDELDELEGTEVRLRQSILNKLVRLYEATGDAEKENLYRARRAD